MHLRTDVVPNFSNRSPSLTRIARPSFLYPWALTVCGLSALLNVLRERGPLKTTHTSGKSSADEASEPAPIHLVMLNFPLCSAGQ